MFAWLKSVLFATTLRTLGVLLLVLLLIGNVIATIGFLSSVTAIKASVVDAAHAETIIAAAGLNLNLYLAASALAVGIGFAGLCIGERPAPPTNTRV
jgi:hypothetical protein